MEKSYKKGGGNFTWLGLMFYLLLGVAPNARGQRAVLSTQLALTADTEYVINGPDKGEVGSGKVYTYTRLLPKAAGQVYWHVEGARLINGKRAKLLQEGDLNARQYPELRIEWDSIKTAQGQGLLQLRQLRPKASLPRLAVDATLQKITAAPLIEEEVDVLASTNVVINCPPCLPDFGLCDSGIYYLGPVGGTSTSVSISEYTYVCSDANTPTAQRYSARWACNGPVYVQGYTYPFTITWRVQYITESGALYEEDWGASRAPFYGNVDTKYIDVTWYNRVPIYSYNSNYSTGLVPLGSLAPNALAGQRIVAARLSYRGGSCGTGGYCGIQEKIIDVYYETPVPASVFAWTGTPNSSPIIGEQHPLPCRTGIYTLQCDDVRDATQYDWTTTVGTITAVGRRATLDLSQVPATTATVTVGVRATNPSAPCGQQSGTHQALFYIPTTPAPSDISIDGVALTCPGANVRTLSVPPVPAGATYTWQITAGNALLLNPLTQLPYPNPTPPTENSVLIQFNGPGQVDVTAVANSACGSTSTPAYASYLPTNGGNPTPLASLNPFNDAYLWQYNATVRIPLSGFQPGVQYRFGPVSNVRTFTRWPGANPSTPTQAASSSLVRVVSGPGGAAYIDLTLNDPSVAEFDLQVQLTGGCGSAGSLTQTIHETRPFHGYYLKADPIEADQLQAPAPSLAERTMVLYPNPAGDVVHIAPPEEGSAYQWVRVLDVQGMPLREVRITGRESLRALSLAGLPAGLYAVQLFDGKRIITRHLAKE